MDRNEPFFKYFGIIVFCISCYLFLIGAISLVFSKTVYANIRSNGTLFRTGIIGFRKTNHIEWKNIEYVEIVEKNLMSYNIGSYLGFGLMEIPAKILLFHLKSPLSENELSNINSLSTKYEPNIHHIRASEDGSELWLKKPPEGGFEALLYEISKYVSVKSIEKASPKRFKSYIAILDITLFGLVSVFLYLVSTNKIILW